ncbi:hypothetical protein Q3G72_025021 [Acer saccharum]|nr:hypothetical protein Q3G72_025021 [Acer saccharum]
MERLGKNFIGFDFGEKSTGLCLADNSMRNAFPIMAPGNWNGIYVLTPLEKILNQIYDGFDFEDDGKLTTKYYNFVDEWNSTRQADYFLCNKFPEIANPNQFLDMYPRIRDDMCYQDQDEQNIKIDLAKFRKKVVGFLRRMLLHLGIFQQVLQ